MIEYCYWREDEDGDWVTDCQSDLVELDDLAAALLADHCVLCGGVLHLCRYSEEDEFDRRELEEGA